MFRALSILTAGYGIAAASAFTVFGAGAGLLPAILTFWLGGAVAVCLIALIGTPYWATDAGIEPSDSERALQEALRRWEADRLEDRAMPVGRTGSDAP